MAYTKHGHRIPGSFSGGVKPDSARCGGPGLCSECSREANMWERANDPTVLPNLPDAEQTFTETPTEESYLEKAERIVFDYVKANLEKTDTHVTFARDEVYVVWFVKTLQNWKALLSTTLPDGMYYEVTYNGDRKESYLDAYKKFDNVSVAD